MAFEWDPAKARLNFRDHRVRFQEAIAVFDDPYAVAVADDEADRSEERFIGIRLISARLAPAHERAEYEAGLP